MAAPVSNTLGEVHASFLVKGVPPTICYLPEFISEAEEQFLMNEVYAAPKPKWTHLLNRRLQNWGGLPHEKGMITESLPAWLLKYCTKIGDLGIFGDKNPNHVLVNEYCAGQGIMPHEDGSLFYPTVSTISIGSHTLLDFYSPITEEQETVCKVDSEMNDCTSKALCTSTSLNERYVASILLEPRSLVIVQDEMYKHYLHGIEERSEDVLSAKNVANLDRTKHSYEQTIKRSTRISLTIRYVPKVLKTKLFFGTKRR